MPASQKCTARSDKNKKRSDSDDQCRRGRRRSQARKEKRPKQNRSFSGENINISSPSSSPSPPRPDPDFSRGHPQSRNAAQSIPHSLSPSDRGTLSSRQSHSNSTSRSRRSHSHSPVRSHHRSHTSHRSRSQSPAPTRRSRRQWSPTPPLPTDDDSSRSPSRGPTNEKTPDIRKFFRRPQDWIRKGVKLTPAKQNFSTCRICVKRIRRKGKSSVQIQWWYASTSSVSTLRGHLERNHQAEYLKACETKGWAVKLPKLKKMMTSEAGSLGSDARSLAITGRPRVAYSSDTFVTHLVNFIVADDQSINVIECPEFRQLLLLLRDDLHDKDIPHRTKVRESIVKAWRAAFKKTKVEMSEAVGKISFTSDIWSNQNLTGFLAVTAHWIGRDVESKALTFKNALIGFHALPSPHSGEQIADTTMEVLDRAGITKKVGHFTLDNAENNATFMVSLEDHLNRRDITFNSKDNRIMCFPHVVNITVQHMLKSLTTAQLDEDKEDVIDNTPPPAGYQTYEEAVKRDPLKRAQGIVRGVRSSGKRRQDFRNRIKNANKEQLLGFVDGKPVKVPELELLRSVKTRWDSVYYMLRRLLEMKQGIQYFLSLDDNRDLSHLALTSVEWTVIEDIVSVLEPAHRVQQLMSSQSTPVLAGFVPVFEQLMSHWDVLATENPNVSKWTTVAVDWANKYYARMDLTTAYILAMFLNPIIRLTWINKQWDTEYCDDAVDVIKKAMRRYYKVANEDAQVQQSRQQAQAGPSKSVPAYLTINKQFDGMGQLYEDMELGEDDHVLAPRTIEEELSAYLGYRAASRSTDILAWWGLHEHEFPTLFRMAMDYLPVQASAVPCERVFSSSAETDTKRRNRLSPDFFEALQMLKFALKKKRLDFIAGWEIDEEAMKVDPQEDDLLSHLLQEGQDNMETVIGRMGRDMD